MIKIDQSKYTKPIVGKVLYSELEELQVMVKKQKYQLLIIDSVNNYDALYSKPTNLKRTPWTHVKFTGGNRPNLIAMYWSPFKPKMKIKVLLDTTSNIAITYKDLQS